MINALRSDAKAGQSPKYTERVYSSISETLKSNVIVPPKYTFCTVKAVSNVGKLLTLLQSVPGSHKV